MSLQKLGDHGSRGVSVAPRAGMLSESAAVCVSLLSPPDPAALECPPRPLHAPWRSVLVGVPASFRVTPPEPLGATSLGSVEAYPSDCHALTPCSVSETWGGRDGKLPMR